jgi:hypothetical protein
VKVPKSRRAILAYVYVALAVAILGILGITVDEADICGALRTLEVDDEIFCTHGGDTAPLGYDEQVAAAVEDGSFTIQPASCGTGDHLLQAVYGNPNDRDRSFATVKRIRREVRSAIDEAATIFRLETSGYDMAWECSSAGRPVVKVVELGGVVDTSYGFNDWVSDARTFLNLQEPNRVYVLFFDDGSDPFKGIPSAYPYSGQGTLDPDTSPGTGNANNTGPAYALIDAISENAAVGEPDPNPFGYNSGWSSWPVVHEVLHNFGAVQLQAPDADGGWHGNDEHDVMTYGKQVTPECTSGPTPERIDCGGDSYFNANPPTGSWLDTHFNLATDSVWIEEP